MYPSRRGGRFVEDSQALKHVVKATAAAKPPEQRQQPEVWESLNVLKVPCRLKTLIRQALWKKLPVNVRCQDKGVKETADCTICGKEETMHID